MHVFFFCTQKYNFCQNYCNFDFDISDISLQYWLNVLRVRQGVRTGLGHGGITCVLQTQFSSFLLLIFLKAFYLGVYVSPYKCKILRQSFAWSFFLLLIFLKAFYLGCWCSINVTSVWLQNSWHHSSANLRLRSQTEISVKIKVSHSDLYFMVQGFCLIFWRLFDL